MHVCMYMYIVRGRKRDRDRDSELNLSQRQHTCFAVQQRLLQRRPLALPLQARSVSICTFVSVKQVN